MKKINSLKKIVRNIQAAPRAHSSRFVSDNHACHHKGFGLVEMVVGAAILSVVLFSISNYFRQTFIASRATESVVQSSYLLEEGVEVEKLFRDMSYTNNFRNMSTTTPYYFLWDGSSWATSTTDVLVDGTFDRSATLSDVMRDANGDIANTGTYDPDTKLVTVSVAWWRPGVGTTTRLIQAYVTNIFNN